MQLSNAKVGTKVLCGHQKGEIVYIPTFVSDKTHKGYNCVAVSYEPFNDPMGELTNLSFLTEIKTIKVTENDLIPCDSSICKYCIHSYQHNKQICSNCATTYDNFLGVEAYRTKKD